MNNTYKFHPTASSIDASLLEHSVTAAFRGLAIRTTLAAFLVVGLGQPAFSQIGMEPPCGSLTNAYGPYDYTNAIHRRERLPVVEQHHFDSNVRELRSGVLTGSALSDLMYTLRAFPNHHFALDAMARLHRQRGTDHIPQARYSLECWFERARRFSPKDGVVLMIHGIHLYHVHDLDRAEETLRAALELMPQSAEAYYNLGLVQVRMGKYESALESAKKAYTLGFPLSGLRDQLRRRGYWPTEPATQSE